MTSTMTLATVLTSQDVRALRSADSLVFQYTDGQGVIRACKSGDRAADGFDGERRIHTDAAVTDYDREPGADRRYAAFHMDHSSQVRRETRTLVGRIGIGDTLSLLWTRSNDCDALRAVGYHQDQLSLSIRKPSGTVQTYLVAVSVGPDNTARMVRTV